MKAPSPATHNANRNVTDVVVLSLIGRALAFVVRAVSLRVFGAQNALYNAFIYAMNVPNMLFTIVGTALSTVMIPVYNGLLAEDKRDEAKIFIDHVISIALVFLFGLTLLGVAGAPLIVRVAGADFEEVAYLTFALRVLMPVMIFFGFGAVFAGLLQSHGRFRLPALVSAPGGLLLIGYVVFFAERWGVTGLIFVTAVGVALQPLLLLPAVIKLGYRFRFRFNLRDANVRMAGRLCVPVLISVASYQAHFFFAQTMALRLEAAALVDFSLQLVQVSIMVLVMAVAAVYFPKLSALWAKNDTADYNQTLRNAFVYTIFFVLPAASGLFLLRHHIMYVLRIDASAELIGLYAIGVVAVGLKEIADRGSYAMKDARTPAMVSVLMMAVNIGTVVLLLPHLEVRALPVAYGLAALVGVGTLLVRLQKKTPFITRRFIYEVSKVVLAAALMVAAVLGALWFATEVRANENMLAQFINATIVGGVVYLAAAWCLQLSPIQDRRGKVK
ncbi:MAG: polysaccharide biosynthesis C-terminal domain-containing protein [Defluviitaleaceae bacterium]|nr:polysaccharide biosynthesis C-terminal domain-containing protein [Defluviitaleaceae bacterium]